MEDLLTATSLAEAFVKVRERLDYSGPLDFEKISSQNPSYKGDKVVIKFNPTGQLDKTVYVQF